MTLGLLSALQGRMLWGLQKVSLWPSALLSPACHSSLKDSPRNQVWRRQAGHHRGIGMLGNVWCNSRAVLQQDITWHLPVKSKPSKDPQGPTWQIKMTSKFITDAVLYTYPCRIGCFHHVPGVTTHPKTHIRTECTSKPYSPGKPLVFFFFLVLTHE